MNKEEILIVQESMELILTEAIPMGEKLYQKLFDKAPYTRDLFHTDIPSQSRKLMSIIIHITANLDQMESLQEELTELAIKHENYNVKPEHYDLLGEALFDTLQETLGNHWNLKVHNAWKSAYSSIANSMITAQQNHVKKQTK